MKKKNIQVSGNKNEALDQNLIAAFDHFSFTLEEALEGVKDANGTPTIRWFIEAAAHNLRCDIPMPTKLKGYLIEALESIAKGENANTAFRLNKSQLGPRRLSVVSKKYVVLHVRDLISQGYKITDAITKVAEDRNYSYEKVRAIYYQNVKKTPVI